MQRREISTYFEYLLVLLFGALFLFLPVLFSTSTTDSFVLPKELLLSAVVLLSVVLFGAEMIGLGQIKIRRTPLDVPVLLFGGALFLSSLFSVNKADSLLAFSPILLLVISYFILTNAVKNKQSILFLLFALSLGAALSGVYTILSFLKIYPLPLSISHISSFTPLGSLLDQALYLLLLLPVPGYFVWKMGKTQETEKKDIGFTVLFIVMLGGLLVTLWELFTLKSQTGGLTLLPFETGFQTAFAAISQDIGRTAVGFLFGSGFGTYINDFLRFKQVTFNTTPYWSTTFIRSSSFLLELLATTGVLGVAAFLYLVLRVIKFHAAKTVKENELYISLLLTFVISLLLPFSPSIHMLLFFLVGLFACSQGLLDESKFFNIELQMVAFKKGIIAATNALSSLGGLTVERNEEKRVNRLLPISFFVVLLLGVLLLGFFAVRYFASDVIFQSSLKAAAKNKGLETYNDQNNAIQLFQYRSDYHRVYSQVNLALANSLASSSQKNGTLSAQTQQTIYQLIQQGINSARNATALGPQTAANWQNLSQVYRSLIGFGQNADNFAILSQQQAVILDPNNPQEYLNLGGIYYQLGQWDNAERQFQIAVNLKPDYANAYYNLGHAFESKGDFSNALVQYRTAKGLLKDDPVNLKKITDEINALEKKAGNEGTQSSTPSASSSKQPPLGISSPDQQLPQQNQPIQIPAPSVSTPSAK